MANLQDTESATQEDVANAHDTKPKANADAPTPDFLDPDHYKYPVDERHLTAALRYINRQRQREPGGYSALAREEMGCKLAPKHTGNGDDYDPRSEQVEPKETK